MRRDRHSTSPIFVCTASAHELAGGTNLQSMSSSRMTRSGAAGAARRSSRWDSCERGASAAVPKAQSRADPSRHGAARASSALTSPAATCG